LSQGIASLHLACAIVFAGAVTFDVLAVFVDAMWAMRHGRMGVCRFRLAHRIVLGLTIGIVFLAKTMFYL